LPIIIFIDIEPNIVLIPSNIAKPTFKIFSKKGKIKVSFNPKGQRGEVDKDVRVRFKNGAGKSEQLTLRIKGCVVPQGESKN